MVDPKPYYDRVDGLVLDSRLGYVENVRQTLSRMPPDHARIFVNETGLTERETPLLAATKAGKTDAMEVLLQFGADPDLPGCDGVGPSPTQQAAINGNDEALSLLLISGADPMAHDSDGHSLAALASHDVDCLLMVFAAGESPYDVGLAPDLLREVVSTLVATGPGPRLDDLVRQAVAADGAIISGKRGHLDCLISLTTGMRARVIWRDAPQAVKAAWAATILSHGADREDILSLAEMLGEWSGT